MSAHIQLIFQLNRRFSGVITVIMGLFLFHLMPNGLCRASTIPPMHKGSVIVVLMVDPTLSGRIIPKPNPADYEAIAQHIALRGGTLSVICIGNPGPSGSIVYRCQLAPPVEVPEGSTLTDKGRIAKQNKKITLDNNQEIRQLLAWIDQYILHYRPQGLDLSKMVPAFTSAQTLLCEPVYDGRDKLLIYVSDLINEPTKPGRIEPWSLDLRLFRNITVWGIGTHETGPFRNFPAFTEISSVSGLIPNLQIFLTK